MDRIRDFLAGIFTRQRIAWGLVSMASLLLLVLFVDQVVMPLYTKHGEALIVPDTLAKRYETAQQMLAQQGLVAVKAGEKNDPNLPFGYVVEQNPRPNRLVKKGRRIYLTISVGEREMPVPKLVALSENNARETLKSYGFRIGEVEYEYNPNELAEVVTKQSIAEGLLVHVGTEIDIVVSLGKPTENVTVPAVFGKTLEAARVILQKSGLTIRTVTYRVDNEYLPHTILDQSLAVGEVVLFGAEIDLLATVVNEADLEN